MWRKEIEKMKKEYRDHMVKWGEEKEMLKKEIGQKGQKFYKLKKLVKWKEIGKDKERNRSGEMESRLKEVERMSV